MYLYDIYICIFFSISQAEFQCEHVICKTLRKCLLITMIAGESKEISFGWYRCLSF